MNKAELERKKNLARTLYMAGKEQIEIAEQIEVSRVTVSKWVNAEGWKEQTVARLCRQRQPGLSLNCVAA